MKLAFLVVCLLGFMLLECHSSPVQLVENHELVAKARALGGRQAATGEVAPAAPAAATDDDDDDDDDEDDEPDLGDLVDDDDDDDDEEEDDDDDDDDEEDDDDEDDTPQGQAAPGATASDDDEDDDDDDYIDRLFDDILGDDDDDDDDDDEDEVSPAVAAAAQPVPAVAPAQPAAAVAPAAQSATAEVVEEAGTNTSDAENAIISAADDAAEGEQNVFYDEENAGIDTKVDIQSLNNKPLESTTAKVSVAAAPLAANEIESSDDDDDDEEDELTGALTGDDDDEDDDDTDDDDDDDDDIVGDDVIEARRARGAEKNVVIEMPKDAFQDRHNQFIDAIFARINRIVSDSYDPFKVRLASTPKQVIKAKPSTTANATKTNKKSKTKKVAGGSKARSTTNADNKTVADVKSETDVPQSVEQSPASVSFIPAEETKQQQQQLKPQSTGTESAEKRTVPSLTGTKNRKKIQPLRATSTVSQANKPATKQKLKQNASNLPSASTLTVDKLRRAEGSLSGLASLRRVGNAKVVSDPEGRNSTIKSKFTLGPLILKVEKSFKRGNVRNVKTATARTNEMIGRIKFSVVNDQATLVSIKVQQPKQVEVESKDNHDRTREFVWRRTPKIARLVSEKLKLAAESLFQPTAGVEVVRL